jgi:hypothetical protein
MATRRRCSECRRTFTPSAKAQTTQRVCGATCRAARDRKLARARRRCEVVEHRAEERQRQQASRALRKAATCHAPASAAKSAELPEEIVRLVDHALSLSRATLMRDLRRKLPGLMQPSGNDPAPVTRQLGRATAG